MDILYPDYDHCLVNLTCSVERHFSVAPDHQTLPLCDRLLEKKLYKNVIVLLLDGMGTAILEKNGDPDGFLCKHLAGEYSSVFPPTTVAATTSVLSGLYPAEHGWLGWDVYFPEVGKNVTVFRNALTGTQEQAEDYPVAQTHRPYKSVIEKIREAGGKAYSVTPFAEPFPQTLEEMESCLLELCDKPGRKYIYGYWPEPDHVMHETGVDSPETKAVLAGLESWVARLSSRLEDTLLLITADHGHVNSLGTSLEAHPEIRECLARGLSIEPRAAACFVKPGMEKIFESRFAAAFGDKFLLLTVDEAIRQGLFGPGKHHPQFPGSVGNYLAVAVGGLSLYETEEEASRFIGVHAGLTAEEMRIPLIAIER